MFRPDTNSPHPVHVAQELRHKSGIRFPVQVFRGAYLDQLASLHDGHAIGDCHGLFLIVRDEQKGNPHLSLEFFQIFAKPFANLGVECRQGLVEQKHLGLEHQGAGQCYALFLPARQFARIARLLSR